MKRGRKLLLVGTPLFVIGGGLVALTAKPKDEFKFLHDLKPSLMRYSAGHPASVAIFTASPSATSASMVWEVMAFPLSDKPKIEQRLHQNLLDGGISIDIEPLVYPSGGRHSLLPSAIATETEEWSDSSGREAYLVWGKSAAQEIRQFTKDSVPEGSCFVLAGRPSSRVEKAIDAVKRFLHVD